MYIYLLLFVLLVIAFFDIYWIIRLAMTRLFSKVANYSEFGYAKNKSYIYRYNIALKTVYAGTTKHFHRRSWCDLLSLLDHWPRLLLPHEQWQVLQGDGLRKVREGKQQLRHNVFSVLGSTSISEQAALPTLRLDQRCLSFNMGRASDIEGGCWLSNYFPSRISNKYLQC